MDNEWGMKYHNGEQAAVWPWSDLVSLVMRYAKPKPGAHVVELVPGMGANVPLFEALACDYAGIDASQTAVEALRLRFPAFCFWTGDFTQDIDYFQSDSLDLVVDRAALTHNPSDAIERCLGMVLDRLKPGGWYIGVDWFGDFSDDGFDGDSADKVLQELRETRFAGLGHVTFSSKESLLGLFHGWEFLCLEHKLTEDYLTHSAPLATWNFVVRPC